MGIGLLYSVDEKYKNKNLIIDYERGEIIDPETGEIIEDHLIDPLMYIRAEDYAEWNSKRYHEVLVSEKDKKLYSVVWSVGEKIGAPKWLRQDVLTFIKKARVLRVRPEIGGRCNGFTSEKFVLATYYVIAKKRGLVGFSERIGKMDCGGVACYKNRRVKDREFHKYVIIVLKLWFILYKDSNYVDEIKNYIMYFAEIIRRVNINIDVYRVVSRATEFLEKYKGIGSFKPKNLAGALVIKAVGDVYGNGVAGSILRKLVEKCNINELSVRNVLSRIENGHGDK